MLGLVVQPFGHFTHGRSRDKKDCPSVPRVFPWLLPFHMVAELDRSTTSFRRRAIAAGDLVLRGVGSSPRPGWPTGFRGVHWILQILGVLIFLVGTVFLYDMSQADGTGTGESQQIANVLQQILAEQQSQRARIDEMGQMIQGAGAAVQMTQQTTEQVVTQVVQQVQAGFAQDQQQMSQAHASTQEQIQQIAQAMQAIQGQVQQQANVVSADQLQQLGTTMQSIQTQMQQMQQATSSGGGAAQSGPGVTAAGSSGAGAPTTPTGGVGRGTPTMFNMGTPPQIPQTGLGPNSMYGVGGGGAGGLL